VDAVADPDEGVAADGTIRTGAHRSQVPAAFEPVLADAVALLGESGASLYVYGSVATGIARPGSSDVDLLSIGLPGAAILGQRLSARYADRCRGVEVAAATAADFAGDTDAAYGYRVFLRHYCVHLAGPDPAAALPAFPAGARAARGFNGDLGQHLRRWRQGLEAGTVAADRLGVRAARKTLLAVAGLVSIHDHTWTTDRSRAVRRWSELEPGLAARLDRLHSWAQGERHPSRDEVECVLADDGVVCAIVERFGRLIGLWTDDPEGQ
jgi:Nucleotidyltransferase domain